MDQPHNRRSSWPRWLGVLALFAIAGAVKSYLFFVVWSETTDAPQSEAELAVAAAIDEAGGGPPYIDLAAGGTVTIRRDLEADRPSGFDTLTLLAWSPARETLLRIDYPRWFVRLKTSTSLNLGTMIAAARQDWGHLDLSVSYDDLRRRGPALLLDHRLESGARIVIWTSRADRRESASAEDENQPHL